MISKTISICAAINIGLLLVNSAFAMDEFSPGAPWPDTAGVHIDAHGGAILGESNNAALTTCLKLEVKDASNGRVGIANEGFWGVPITPRTTYHVSFFAKADLDSAGPLTLSLRCD
jgi:hypothetical protein